MLIDFEVLAFLYGIIEISFVYVVGSIIIIIIIVKNIKSYENV